jgi:hypothetical protein
MRMRMGMIIIMDMTMRDVTMDVTTITTTTMALCLLASSPHLPLYFAFPFFSIPSSLLSPPPICSSSLLSIIF